VVLELKKDKIEGKEFREDLQGLRAIAVLFVLLFHAGVPGLKGGFSGVDIFFVLSGFLITGNLLREAISTGTVSLQNFYAKRIRRLLPASLLVLFLTLLTCFLFLPPVLIPNFVGDITSAVLYVSNMSFASQATDYFASGATPSPVLHFWSLGVEEQFYIFWPIAVLLLMRSKLNARHSVRLFALIIFAASLIFAVWLLPRSQPWAFFSLPTRAWELALGAILATVVSQAPKMDLKLINIGGFIGLVLIIFSGFFMANPTGFPGFLALVPTIGAALIIFTGANNGRTVTGNLLSVSPMRYIGKISYSLYLWHWPLFVIPAIIVGHTLSWSARFLLFTITFAAASLSERFIEKPFKAGFLTHLIPKRTFYITLISMILIITSAFTFRYESLHGFRPFKVISSSSSPVSPTKGSARPTTIDRPVPKKLHPSLFNAKTDRSINYADHCHTQLNMTASTAPCLYGDLKSKTNIVLFGDSHALAWFPAVNKIAKLHRWKLYSQTMSSCGPADIPAWSPSTGSLMANCPIWRDGAIKKIIAVHPLFILVGGTRGFATLNSQGSVAGAPENHLIWETGMKRNIDKFKAAGIKVIMLSDVPVANGDPVVCLSSHPDSSIACANPVSKAIDTGWLNTERKVSKEEGITLIEPQMWVCPTDPCPVIIKDTLVYFDPGHMTATFSASLSPKLDVAIARALL
jgi:peptidoglycan/LPS O-acetylase OafA/YrhL